MNASDRRKLRRRLRGNTRADKQRHKRWAAANRPLVNARYKKWYDSKGKHVLLAKNKQPLRALKRRLSGRIHDVLKKRGATKCERTIPLLGCSVKSFMLYLESKFEVGMTWDNFGRWEIDHILPCALFDLTKPDHQRRCFHFSNLQPLWKPENASKGAKLFHGPEFLPLRAGKR